MRAILINPDLKTVSEVDEPVLDLPTLYRLIGCTTIQLVRVADVEHFIVVDEEGLLAHEPKAMFTVRGYAQPLAGIGVIVGDEDEVTGKLTAATLDVERVREAVSFPEIEFDHMEMELGVVDHPVLGPGTFTHTQIPVFRRK